MVTTQEFHFPSSDGVHSIAARRWLPEGPPRGVVQLVHGISEHMGRYDTFARFLAGHGFAVAGHDHLGHGRTARDPSEYGWFGERDGWKYVVKDVRALRERMGAEHPGAPYFLLGHSMGSFVVRGYLMFWPGTVDGAILSGTGQEPPRHGGGAGPLRPAGAGPGHEGPQRPAGQPVRGAVQRAVPAHPHLRRLDLPG